MKPKRVTQMLMQSLFSQPKLSLKLATIRVLDRLISVLKPEPVDAAVGEKFVPKILKEIGKGLCVWISPSSVNNSSFTSRASADDNEALIAAFTSLARTMFESDIWHPIIMGEINKVLENIPSFVIELEQAPPSSYLENKSYTERIWKMFASISILGGDFVSTNVGSRVLVTGEGAAEVGTVVALNPVNSVIIYYVYIYIFFLIYNNLFVLFFYVFL